MLTLPALAASTPPIMRTGPLSGRWSMVGAAAEALSVA